MDTGDDLVNELRQAPATSDIERTLGLRESLAVRMKNRWVRIGGAGAIVLLALLVLALRSGGDHLHF